MCNKKTLSNGLVIEDLKTGKSKGKVAAAGKKVGSLKLLVLIIILKTLLLLCNLYNIFLIQVKVQYVVTLKENGQVIDSNGKSPYKFRLGILNILYDDVLVYCYFALTYMIT